MGYRRAGIPPKASFKYDSVEFSKTANLIQPIKVERVKGIEPSYAAWEAAVLPLNYTRRENSE